MNIKIDWMLLMIIIMAIEVAVVLYSISPPALWAVTVIFGILTYVDYRNNKSNT